MFLVIIQVAGLEEIFFPKVKEKSVSGICCGDSVWQVSTSSTPSCRQSFLLGSSRWGPSIWSRSNTKRARRLTPTRAASPPWTCPASRLRLCQHS